MVDELKGVELTVSQSKVESNGTVCQLGDIAVPPPGNREANAVAIELISLGQGEPGDGLPRDILKLQGSDSSGTRVQVQF